MKLFKYKGGFESKASFSVINEEVEELLVVVGWLACHYTFRS